MNYCPKCGNKINDGDKFCSNCGYKVEVVIERNDDYYSNNYIKNRVSNTPSGASKTAFILSIIGIVLFLIEIFIIGFADEMFPASIFILFFMLDCALAIASLATAIPGFVSARKNNIKSKIVIAAFVLSIILISMVMFLYICLPSGE